MDSFSRNYISRHRRFVAPATIPEKFDRVILHGSGEGMWVNTTDGKRALVADADLGVAALGYNHPKLMEFRRRNPNIFDSCDAPGRYYIIQNIDAGWKKYAEISQARLAEHLIRITFPRSRAGEKMVIWDLGGGPLVSKIVRYLLRVKPERTHFLAFRRGFHGRFVPELTNSNPTQKEYAPHSGITVHVLPYPETAKDLQATLKTLPYIPKKNVNAIFIEGIQGEGGVNHPNSASLRALCRVLKKEIPEISIVFDEIQTGLGRTGKWFSYEHYGTTPDVVLIGKALGGGLPISAAIVPHHPLAFSWHGGTFPGYPAAIAQATVTLDIIEKEGLLKNAARMGKYMAQKIYNLCRRHKGVCPKGFGLMQGIEFRKKDGSGDPQRRDKVLKRLIAENIFTTDAGIASQNPTIRIMPPLIVDRKTIDLIIEKLKEALS